MPLYSFSCPDCCHEFEEVRPVAERDDETICLVCSCQMVRGIHAPSIIGATPTYPIDMTKQLGRKFETNSEYRSYLKENAGKEVSKADVRPRIEAARDRAEKRAKAQGYRDNKHRVREVKKKLALDGK